eukprot:759579-Hanusia_phi.AAC.8
MEDAGEAAERLNRFLSLRHGFDLGMKPSAHGRPEDRTRVSADAGGGRTGQGHEIKFVPGGHPGCLRRCANYPAEQRDDFSPGS